MNKKGQDISMNIIVTAIIALLVLVILVIVFTGGITNTVDKMRTFLTFGTSGKTMEFAKEQCNANCAIAKGLDNPSSSSYCTQEFKMKENDKMVSYVCDIDNNNAAGDDLKGLNIGCNVDC